jgi:pyridoxamine 5'-phosphate oxidase family protein
MSMSKKFRDAGRTGIAAFVVDDFAQGHPRGLEVRGRAETILEGGDALGRGADPAFIRLWPEYIVSWGIETEATKPNGRAVSARR